MSFAPINVACLGMGWWSDVLADAMKRSDKFFIRSCYSRSEDKRAASGKRSAGAVKMIMGQTELAEYMGTTRVPVCRAVNTLKRSGVISYKRGELTVLDMNKLRSIAGNDQ